MYKGSYDYVSLHMHRRHMVVSNSDFLKVALNYIDSRSTGWAQRNNIDFELRFLNYGFVL